MGFSVPAQAWLRGPLRQWAGDMLLTADFRRMFPFRHETILDLWDGFQSGAVPSGYQMWSLVMLAGWAHSAASDQPAARI